MCEVQQPYFHLSLFPLASVEPFQGSTLFSLLAFQFHYFCIAVTTIPKRDDLGEKRERIHLAQIFRSLCPEQEVVDHSRLKQFTSRRACQETKVRSSKDYILAMSPFPVTFFLQLHLHKFSELPKLSLARDQVYSTLISGNIYIQTITSVTFLGFQLWWLCGT